MAEIKNIIFDLGGVILNLNYQLTSKAFEKLGVDDFDNYYSQKEQTSLFNSFETGLISTKDFIKSAQHLFTHNLAENDIIVAWNSMLLDLPEHRLSLLQELKKNLNLFLLSNTNEIHITSFENQMKKENQLETFFNSFKKIYYSSRIGLRKPDLECFEYVLKENDLLAEETLFIDDSIQHIHAATKLGLKTYHLQKNEDINSIFPDIIQSRLH
jgi:putative hydrolase of the HAD superfamily